MTVGVNGGQRRKTADNDLGDDVGDDVGNDVGDKDGRIDGRQWWGQWGTKEKGALMMVFCVVSGNICNQNCWQGSHATA
jgi:hypothetical protein